jgi:hypothetical protein
MFVNERCHPKVWLSWITQQQQQQQQQLDEFSSWHFTTTTTTTTLKMQRQMESLWFHFLRIDFKVLIAI